MADEVTRQAARLATIITVPVVLLAGVLVFVLLGGAGDGGEPGRGPGDLVGHATAAPPNM